MELIATNIRIAAPPGRVLEAMTSTAGFQAWWTEDCDVGRASGEEAVFRFGPREVVFRIDRVEARGIEMTCVREKGQPDWLGTHLAFRALPEGAGTYLDLLHDGYAARNAFYEKCVGGWDHYLKSLRAYCETGLGAPWGSTLHPRAQTPPGPKTSG